MVRKTASMSDEFRLGVVREKTTSSAWRKSAFGAFIALSAVVVVPWYSLAQGTSSEQEGVRVFKGAGPSPPGEQLIVRADRQGHFLLDAAVNGAPIRFIVDTGSTFVALNKRDAAALGIDVGQLVFNSRVSTANGEVKAASVRLQEIRHGERVMKGVAAIVVEKLENPLLGMSFLRRLKSYEMRGDTLTIIW